MNESYLKKGKILKKDITGKIYLEKFINNNKDLIKLSFYSKIKNNNNDTTIKRISSYNNLR
jgi:hypothetical protein